MRRAYKWVLWIVLGPVVALLIVGLSWLAFNGPWADAPVRQVPAELEPTGLTLAPQDNAFFDMQGLTAPAGEAVNAWGQRAWRDGPPADSRALSLPQGPAWQCQPAREDCVARWRADAAVLRTQLAEAHVLGDRCRALAARPRFEEVLVTQPGQSERALAARMPAYLPLSICLRWLQIEAVLVPELAPAQLAWAQADALLRLQAGGASSLLGQAIAWSQVSRQQLLLAQWAATQSRADALLDAWLAPLPASLLQPRRWMVAEAAFQRAMTLDMSRQLQDAGSKEPAWLRTLAGLGMLPQRTVQAADDTWLADLAAFGDLQGAALAQALAQAPRGDSPTEPFRWSQLKWRNTAGHILLDVARPMRAQYAHRQADVPVLQAALRAVRELNALPAGERAARWPTLVQDAGLRERLQLEGDALQVRPWQPTEGRDTLRLPLRPA